MSIDDQRVKLFLNQDVPLDSISEEKIRHVLSFDDISKIVVLPDIHSKPDNPIPTGIATLTKRTIYPFAIGQEIGCGVRVLKTSLHRDDISDDEINALFKNITSLLRDSLRKDALLSKEEYIDILMDGYKWAEENCPLEKKSKAQKGEPMLPGGIKVPSRRRLLKIIPKDAFRGGFYRFGVLGGGNHFLELQEVDEIFEEDIASEMGLRKGSLVFMFHTGSGVFSKRADNYYGIRYQDHRWDKELRANIRKLLFHSNDFNLGRLPLRYDIFMKKNYKGIPQGTPEAERFLTVLNAALNYSYVNRCLISKFIQESVSKCISAACDIQLVADVAHERIDLEDFNGTPFWVHRNGASRLEYLEGDKTTLVPLPGFPGGPSFLCVPQEGLRASFCSVNHGAGRRLTKSQARKTFEEDEIIDSFKYKKIKLYKLGRENASEQAPEAFKDVHKVLNVLRDTKLTKPVVSTKPLAIIKG